MMCGRPVHWLRRRRRRRRSHRRHRRRRCRRRRRRRRRTTHIKYAIVVSGRRSRTRLLHQV